MDYVQQLLKWEEERLDGYLKQWRSEKPFNSFPEMLHYSYHLDHLGLMLPLYCHPGSAYYRNPEILQKMNDAVSTLLKIQLPSGCISLANCNIDSPPDTAFAVHRAALQYQLAERYRLPEMEEVIRGLYTFLERASPCLLTGGIHTPNHRWVMCGALAKMYEIFGDDAFRKRAFQYLDEGFDITDYGEWTERSNATYNPVCAIHLYDVGVQFQYEPAWEAIRKNLRMMAYMLHPGNTIVTEYSGRQDLAQTMTMDERYAVVYHLMANRDQDPLFAAMANIASGSKPTNHGTNPLIYWMLYPDKMKLPSLDRTEPLPETYTILFGEGNEVAVPQNVPYSKFRRAHPHGAPVLRHRRSRLSVTVMAGQPNILYVQYGKARMTGFKLVPGWFGMGGIAFPTIRRTGDNTYQMHIELEGCYFQPLPKELVHGAKGRYVDMPNHLREKSHVTYLPVTVNIRLLEDGVDVEWISEQVPNIYLQAVCMFDPKGRIEGAEVNDAGPHIKELAAGEAVYRYENDWIRVAPGVKRHGETVIRGDRVNTEALNLTLNDMTPVRRSIQIRGGTATEHTV